jgi:nicotinamidase-related amidase
MADTWVKNQGTAQMRIDRNDCTGLVIDMQEKLFPHMFRHQLLLQKSFTLIEGLKILGIPLTVTEQYSKGLGPTLEPVKMALTEIPVIQKTAFSCCDEPLFTQEVLKLNRKTWIICGIEAHVCVLQTVMGLVSMGRLPVVVSDATSSRDPEDKRAALERMKQEGAIITTCESILFELARISGTTEFKSISKLVK